MRIFICLLLVACGTKLQQPKAEILTGTLIGMVMDEESLESISNAEIKLTKRDTITYTDLDGFYVLLNLSRGFYDLKVTYQGYRPYILQGVCLAPGISVEFDIMLKKEVLTNDSL